mgnify:FL=1
METSTAIWTAVAAVAIALAVGWYYTGSRPAPAPVGADEATSRLQVQGTSDEVSAIEADVNATNLTGLDAELLEVQDELAR